MALVADKSVLLHPIKPQFMLPIKEKKNINTFSKSKIVGCDLKLGSKLQVDSCGVCGGDNSCLKPPYHWTLISMSLCSATCGVGAFTPNFHPQYSTDGHYFSLQVMRWHDQSARTGSQEWKWRRCCAMWQRSRRQRCSSATRTIVRQSKGFELFFVQYGNHVDFVSF